MVNPMFTRQIDRFRDSGDLLPLSPPTIADRQGAVGANRFSMELERQIRQFVRHGEPGGTVVPLTQSAQVVAMRLQGSIPPMQGGSVVTAAGEGPAGFVQDILPYARKAGMQLGISPELIVAHAALESGWGTQPLRREDGRSTFNLFGIKADKSWHGDVQVASTTEYLDGRPAVLQEPFRAYSGLQQVFDDYARLIGGERYHAVRGVADNAHAFANGLMRAGYATDPGYAKKLIQVVAKVRQAVGAG